MSKLLKLDLYHRANVESLLGKDFITMLEEIGESIKPEIETEEEKDSHTPPSSDDSTKGKGSNTFTTALINGSLPTVPRRDKRPVTPKDAITITQAFNIVILDLKKLPLPSERKIDDDSDTSMLIESIITNVKTLTQVAKLSNNELKVYGLIQGLTWLAKKIVRLTFILSGAALGYTVNSVIPVMGIPVAVAGGIEGDKLAKKALLACSRYAGINGLNRRPYQAEKTVKLEEIIKSKARTPGR